MKKYGDLETRMKEYENIPKDSLMRKVPVMVRIDGRSFHTFTQGFLRPFDPVLMKAMQETTKKLCESVQGCRLGYTQSDEISLFLADYDSIDSQPYFGYQVEKMVSTLASSATRYFNKLFRIYAQDFLDRCPTEVTGTELIPLFGENTEQWVFPMLDGSKLERYIRVLKKAVEEGAEFDCRVWNLPKHEVTNYFFWRQDDASKNSIQMVGQSRFTQKQLTGVSCSGIQDMLHEVYGVNWNDFQVPMKRGTCCIKTYYLLEGRDKFPITDPKSEQYIGKKIRGKWVVDENIPIFKGEGREYVERLVE